MAVMATVFSFSANAQEAGDNASLEARYMGLAQKLGNTPFTAKVKEGKLTCYRLRSHRCCFNCRIFNCICSDSYNSKEI